MVQLPVVCAVHDYACGLFLRHSTSKSNAHVSSQNHGSWFIVHNLRFIAKYSFASLKMDTLGAFYRC